MPRLTTPAIAAGALMLSLALPLAPVSMSDALAFGGGGGGTKAAEKCKRGEVYSKRQKKCVPDDNASLTDEDRYETGRSLALAGRYDDALVVLATADAGDKRVLNYLGYASRNAGDVEAGMAYYRAALAIDPDYALTRSYMGQAMVLEGDMAGAYGELRRIRQISGLESPEYVALLKSIKSNGKGYGRW